MNTYTLPGKDISVTEEELQDLIQQREAQKQGVPKIGDVFYYISTEGHCCEDSWEERPWQRDYFEVNNAFLAREDAEKEINKRKAFARIQRFIQARRMQDTAEPTSYYISYCASDGSLTIQKAWGNTFFGAPFSFKFSADAELVIREFRPELITLLKS